MNAHRCPSAIAAGFLALWRTYPTRAATENAALCLRQLLDESLETPGLGRFDFEGRF